MCRFCQSGHTTVHGRTPVGTAPPGPVVSRAKPLISLSAVVEQQQIDQRRLVAAAEQQRCPLVAPKNKVSPKETLCETYYIFLLLPPSKVEQNQLTKLSCGNTPSPS